MKEKEDKAKLQLLKYLIGADSREIYNTLKFDKEEKDRALKEEFHAFDASIVPFGLQTKKWRNSGEIQVQYEETRTRWDNINIHHRFENISSQV